MRLNLVQPVLSNLTPHVLVVSLRLCENLSSFCNTAVLCLWTCFVVLVEGGLISHPAAGANSSPDAINSSRSLRSPFEAALQNHLSASAKVLVREGSSLQAASTWGL